MRQASEAYVEAIGYTDLDDEQLMSKLARLEMIDLACGMNSPGCLTQMHEKFVSYLDGDGEKLPVNLEASILCYGLMASPINGSLYIDKLLVELWKSHDTEYRLRVIDAVGCYEDVDGLLDFILTTIATDNRYRKGEHVLVLQSAYSKSNAGIEAVMKFLHANGSHAIGNYDVDDLIEIIVEDLPVRIFDLELYEQVRGIFYPKNIP